MKFFEILKTWRMLLLNKIIYHIQRFLWLNLMTMFIFTHLSFVHFFLLLLLGIGASLVSTVASSTSISISGWFFSLCFQSGWANTSSLWFNKNWIAWFFRSVALWISASTRTSIIWNIKKSWWWSWLIRQDTDLVHWECRGEVLAADTLQVSDVVLVSCCQQQVALVRQVLQSTTVDELDHVSHRGEVNILGSDS